MSEGPARFVWYELMTTDPAAAESFYRGAIGWETRDFGKPDVPYTLLSAGSTMVGGLMRIPEIALANGARPAWTGYVGVPDVDACVARVRAAGGPVHHPPEDIPGVGRFAVVADPQGAAFIVFRGSSDEAPAPVAPGTPGHVGWHELMAGDLDSAFAFYADMFGWTRAAAVDMGPMGIYQVFATGGAPAGGMMTRPPSVPKPSWLYYFNVDAIDAAVARVGDGGGRTVNGPHQVPGGSWIAQCTDPQGAMFAMVAPKR
jgi:predicted enzyme related to lactoylglutathione lyase